MIDREELTRLLHEHRVYDVGAYGWLNENDVDDEYIGHAMWQLDPPFEPDWDALFTERVPSSRPSELAEELTVAGHDFTTLLQLSRLSSGLLLAHRSDGLAGTEPSLCELFYLDAAMKLDVAADRLRAVQIVAVTGAPAGRLQSRKDVEHAEWFTTPFTQAERLLGTRPGWAMARSTGSARYSRSFQPSLRRCGTGAANGTPWSTKPRLDPRSSGVESLRRSAGPTTRLPAVSNASAGRPVRAPRPALRLGVSAWTHRRLTSPPR